MKLDTFNNEPGEYYNMTVERKVIHVQWEGPFGYYEARDFVDKDIDYGIYQIYGNHPVYGPNTLLYIGQARYQTLGERIAQHGLVTMEYNEGHVSLYVGRLSGPNMPSNAEWNRQIDQVEHLLIINHKPAHNAQRIKKLPKKADRELREVHVLNWGDYNRLLPEVSGDRWTDKWLFGKEYMPYGSHPKKKNTNVK